MPERDKSGEVQASKDQVECSRRPIMWNNENE